jgi:cell division septation protein DedD
VVIFLCGVLVGRGVRAQRGDLVQTTATTDLAPAPTAEVTRTPAPTGAPPATPPPAVDDLSYFNRLEKTTPPVETLKPAADGSRPAATTNRVVSEPAKPARGVSEPVGGAPTDSARRAAPDPVKETAAPARIEPPAATKPVARAEATEPPAAPPIAPVDKAPAAADPAPSTPGYAVQVAALNVRSEADAMARRLSSKGYSAYVLASANGAPAVYRVRIGTFKTRREAEALAARLQKEEQIKPWVTR